MAKGRKAQSKAAAEAKGTRDRSAKAAKVPLPPVKQATPPSLSANGKKLWAQIAPLLAPMGFFRETDREPLARYCENLANWWHCERELRRGEPVYETVSKHGKLLRVHPMLTAQNMYEKRLVALEDRLGLSPRARQEILRGLAAAPAELPFTQRETGEDDHPVEPQPANPLGLLNQGSNAIN